MAKKILMVLTSHDRLGTTGRKTGFWLEEFAEPYYVFHDAGADVVLASPRGGRPPQDPESATPDAQTEATRRFAADAQAQAALADTRVLREMRADDFDALFFPGGHGPMWDLAEDRDATGLIETFARQGKPVGAVCHGPAAFRHARDGAGQPLVRGRAVTGFSNSEEAAMKLTDVVPFLLEDMLRGHGGRYTSAADFASHVEADRGLVTGQNPASSEPAARALLEQLR